MADFGIAGLECNIRQLSITKISAVDSQVIATACLLDMFSNWREIPAAILVANVPYGDIVQTSQRIPKCLWYSKYIEHKKGWRTLETFQTAQRQPDNEESSSCSSWESINSVGTF